MKNFHTIEEKGSGVWGQHCQEKENGAFYPPLPLQLERGRGLENWKERRCIMVGKDRE